MAKKVVLISYLQSNKKYVITEQHPERHVAFLREQFLVNLKKTNATASATASATVTLQRFDPVFDCLVDLEDDDEVHDKDRLTAVVSTVSSEETKDPVAVQPGEQPVAKKPKIGESDVEVKKNIIRQKLRDEKNAQGIAFIISMFGKGTDVDVDEMASTFTKLNFAVYREQYLTSAQLCCLVKAASDSNYPSSYKYVVFYYSGHGGCNNSGNSFILPLKVGESNEEVYIEDDIISPFVNSPKAGKFARCFLFFFDCCLSYAHTDGKITTAGTESPLKFTTIPKECLVAYATSKGAKAAGGSRGGIWSSILCKNLQKDISLAEVLDKTREEVKKFQGDELEEQQLPQVSSNVSGVYLKDGVDRGFSIMRKSPNIFELHRLIEGVSVMWYEIGTGLEVDENFRDGLKNNIVGQDSVKLEKVLRRWEDSQCSPVTWDRIIKVLDFVGKHKLATKVGEHTKEPGVIAKYREEEDFQEIEYGSL